MVNKFTERKKTSGKYTIIPERMENDAKQNANNTDTWKNHNGK